MRNWINSEHFPQEQRISINLEYDESMEVSDIEMKFINELSMNLNNCEWSIEGVNNSIRESATKIELHLREAFKLLYKIFLGKERGPKLATILAELERKDVTSYLDNFR